MTDEHGVPATPAGAEAPPPPADPQAAAPPAPAAAPPAPRLSRVERREKAVADALRTLVRDLHMEEFGTLPPREPEVDLTVQLAAHPGRNWELRFSPPLSEQILRQLEDAQAGVAVYRRGRVYCFRCESSGCEHSAPPASLSVFRGYAPNGCPEWHDLTQALLEEKDERVDRLFADRPEVVTLVQFGRALKTRQLSSFGLSSKTYALLGQVVAGYFFARGAGGRPGAPDNRFAVTFQAVEARAADGTARIELNAVARPPGDVTLDDVFASESAAWMHRAYLLAERALKNIERRVVSAAAAGDMDETRALLSQVPVILRRFSEWLERGQRQSQRRTRHVEERRQVNRPVHKAVDDALAAAAGSVFFDEKTSAFVVCGPQGRAHVFSPEGRHVTSFVLDAGAVEFRLRTRRWRAATATEVEQTRARIRAQIPAAPPAARLPPPGAGMDGEAGA